jgi:hypothetical protein
MELITHTIYTRRTWHATLSQAPESTALCTSHLTATLSCSCTCSQLALLPTRATDLSHMYAFCVPPGVVLVIHQFYSLDAVLQA